MNELQTQEKEKPIIRKYTDKLIKMSNGDEFIVKEDEAKNIASYDGLMELRSGEYINTKYIVSMKYYNPYNI